MPIDTKEIEQLFGATKSQTSGICVNFLRTLVNCVVAINLAWKPKAKIVQVNLLDMKRGNMIGMLNLSKNNIHIYSSPSLSLYSLLSSNLS